MSSSSPFTQAPAREIYPLQNSELDIFLIPSVARQVRAFMNLQSCSARQAVIWLGDEMRKRLFECGPGQSIVRRCLRDRRLNMKEWHEKTLSWEYRYLHMEWTQQLSMVNSGGPIPKLITHTYQDFTRSVRLQRELEEREEHDRCVARCGKAAYALIRINGDIHRRTIPKHFMTVNDFQPTVQHIGDDYVRLVTFTPEIRDSQDLRKDPELLFSLLVLSPSLEETANSVHHDFFAYLWEQFQDSNHTGIVGSRLLSTLKEDLMTTAPLRKMSEALSKYLGNDREEGALGIMMLDRPGISSSSKEVGDDGTEEIEAVIRAVDGYEKLENCKVSVAGLAFSLARAGFTVDREVLKLHSDIDLTDTFSYVHSYQRSSGPRNPEKVESLNNSIKKEKRRWLGIKKNKPLINQLQQDLEIEQRDLVYFVSQQKWAICREFTIPSMENESVEDHHRRMNQKWTPTLALEPSPSKGARLVYGLPRQQKEEEYQLLPGEIYVDLRKVGDDSPDLFSVAADFPGGKGKLLGLDNLVYDFGNNLWENFVRDKLRDGIRYQDGTYQVKLLAPSCVAIDATESCESQDGGAENEKELPKLPEIERLDSGIGGIKLGS